MSQAYIDQNHNFTPVMRITPSSTATELDASTNAVKHTLKVNTAYSLLLRGTTTVVFGFGPEANDDPNGWIPLTDRFDFATEYDKQLALHIAQGGEAALLEY